MAGGALITPPLRAGRHSGLNSDLTNYFIASNQIVNDLRRRSYDPLRKLNRCPASKAVFGASGTYIRNEPPEPEFLGT